jgi:hypothetical protein
MRWPSALQPVLDEQSGLLTRRQVYEAAVSRSQLRWAIGRSCRIVLPGVISTFTGELDVRQRLIAGQLWAGPHAQLAGATAVRWHAIGEVPDDGLVRLLVGWSHEGGRSAFAVRRRTSRLDPKPWRRGVLQICSRARALVDAAREIREGDAVRHLLISAVQRRYVREADLLAELEAGAIRGSKVTRQALRDVATGAWSVPEADVLAELARSTVLPRVWPNPVLRAVADNTLLPSPDFWIDDVALAGQVHSRQYHARDEDWEGTVATDTVFGEYGIPLLTVTPSGFARDPGGFRRRVERAYQAAQRRGARPLVRMVPRGPGFVDQRL